MLIYCHETIVKEEGGQEKKICILQSCTMYCVIPVYFLIVILTEKWSEYLLKIIFQKVSKYIFKCK